MLRLIILSVIQAVLMCGAQSMFKVAAEKMESFTWTWYFFRDSILTNWWLLAAGIAGLAGLLEWMYMLKNYPFSQVYPLTSLSFLLGMFVAVIFFHETVVWQQWIGVLLILAGCALVAR